MHIHCMQQRQSWVGEGRGLAAVCHGHALSFYDALFEGDDHGPIKGRCKQQAAADALRREGSSGSGAERSQLQVQAHLAG